MPESWGSLQADEMVILDAVDDDGTPGLLTYGHDDEQERHFLATFPLTPIDTPR